MLEEKLRRGLARGYCHPDNSSKELDCNLIEAMVTEVLSIIQQEIADAKPKWISVKDRLPEKGQQVLAYNPTDKEEPFWVDYLFLNANKELRWDMGMNEVTHWMTLPESPKESE